MAGFTIEITVSAGDLSFTPPFTNVGTYNGTIYWGDTSQSTITAYDDPDRVHTYASAGTYDVEFVGAFPGWSFNNSGDRLKLTDIIYWGDAVDFDGFESLTNAFYGCANIVSLGSGSLQINGVTELAYFFSDCTALSGSIHADLFANCAGVTSLSRAFRYCSNLTGIAAGAFDAMTSLTNMRNTFRGCDIQTLPAALFQNQPPFVYFDETFRDNNNLQLRADMFYSEGGQSTRFLNTSVDFDAAFSRFTFGGTQGTAPDLWRCDYGTGTPSTVNTFGFAGNSPTSLDNYKNIPVAWGGSAVSAPTITDVDTDEIITPGQTGVVVTGTDLLPYQYDGKIELANNATYGSATVIVEQTVTSWSDTAAQITVVQGGLSAGTVYAFVTTDRGDQNATGFAVTLQAAGGDVVGIIDGISAANVSQIDGIAIASIGEIDGIPV